MKFGKPFNQLRRHTMKQKDYAVTDLYKDLGRASSRNAAVIKSSYHARGVSNVLGYLTAREVFGSKLKENVTNVAPSVSDIVRVHQSPTLA